MLAFSHHRQGHLGALFSPDQLPDLIHAHVPDILFLHTDEQVIGLDARLLGRSTLGDHKDQKSRLVLLGLDGDAHTHVGVFLPLHVVGVFIRRDIVAPPVPGGLDHGHGRRVLQLLLVRFPNITLLDQALQPVQLGNIPHANRCQRHHCRQRCYQHIGAKFQHFLFHVHTSR